MRLTKRTKIIATLGPASFNKDVITRLINRGVDIFRINGSHTNRKEFSDIFGQINDCAIASNRQIGILLDLQGPKIRTGKLKDGKSIKIETGSEIEVTSENIEGDSSMISIPHKDIFDDIRPGDTILLADGMMSLTVLRKDETTMTCKITAGGILGEHKGVNLPGVNLKLSSLTPKDEADLKAGLEAGIDYVALSFVRTADDLHKLRELMGAYCDTVRVVAKIEKPEAVRNINEILTLSDAIMVARGDLGVETPIEQITLVQKWLVKMAHKTCKPVIVATQMMESMIYHWQPTRAEVTDVANAVLDGCDACMLSGETAVGKFPDKTVSMMNKIVQEVELHSPLVGQIDSWGDSANDSTHALAESACFLARESQASAILALSISGNTALKVSNHRPRARIFGLSPDKKALRRMNLYWGVTPVETSVCTNTDEMIESAKQILRDKKLLPAGESIVIIAGQNPISGATTLIKLDTL